MPLHFSPEELSQRRQRTIEAMTAEGLDGLLMFRQESMYYLTGYDSFDYVHFQCLYLGADGTMTLVTRSPDLRQARYTSMIEDIRIWVDALDADPAHTDLRPVLEEHGCRDKRLGMEWEAYGLTSRNARRLAAALDGFAELEDASELVTRLRAVKSAAEIVHVRRAAKLADAALHQANRLAVPDAFEGDVLAAMQGAVFRGGGDYQDNTFVIGSGSAATLGRTQSDRRVLSDDDQLTIEFAGVYKHYHACPMRTIKVGKPNKQHKEMHRIGLDCLEVCKVAIRPGRPVGEVLDAYLRTIEVAPYGDGRFNACGYSLGTTFQPNWMDCPMFYHGNPVLAEPGMVFFMHMDVRDDDADLTAIPGETVLVTESGCERLSEALLAYVHNP